MKFTLITILLAVVIIIGAASLKNNANNANPEPSLKDTNTATVVGQPVPDFTLTSYNGEEVTMSAQKGKKVVLFFNEGIMCYPACWNQIAALGNDSYFNSDDVVAYSIVPDIKDRWVEAINQMPELGNGNILLDSTKKVTRQFNMTNLASSMHKGGLAGHTFLIIDEDGIIRFVYDDVEMGVRNELLKAELAKI